MKKRILITAALIGAAIACVQPFLSYWGVIIYSNELLLTMRVLRLAQGIAALLVVGVGWTLFRGLRRGRLASGAIPMGLIAAGAGWLFFAISPVVPQIDTLRNQVRDCGEINMATIYAGVLRYWEDHHYQNPPGTGPGGKLTQADWRRALEPYRVVWSGLQDHNGEPLTLFRCPADKSKNLYSYEINPDLVPAPDPPHTWIIRESWDPTGRYHHGYMNVLFPNTRYGVYYVLPLNVKQMRKP